MSNTTSQNEELKRYIFDEMTENERENLDERFFEDTELFYEYVELKDDLTDRYARSELSGEDLKRFEKTLINAPAEREKIATARVFQKLIQEELKEPESVAELTFWQKIAGAFKLKTSTLQYAGAALIIFLICTAGFFIYRDWQTKQEFAEIENRKEAEQIEKENRLKQLEFEEVQRRIEEQRRQNEENNSLPENSNVASPDNTESNNTISTKNINADSDLQKKAESEKRKKEIEKLKQEIEDSKRNSRNPQPKIEQPLRPIITTVLSLVPIGQRGGDDNVIKIDADTKQIKFDLELPDGETGENFDIKLDGKTIAKKQKPRKTSSGKRILPVTISVKNLNDKKHKITAGKLESEFFIERK